MLFATVPQTAIATVTNASEFIDLPSQYYEVVQFVLDNGLMNGTGQGTYNGRSGERFSPDNLFSRAMMVTVLYRFTGEPTVDYNLLTYDDVSMGTWYTDAVAWATEFEIVNGFGDGTFQPDATITCEQAFTIFHRFATAFYDSTASVPHGDHTTYSDSSAVSVWAKDAADWVVGAGIYNGDVAGNMLKPKEEMKRIDAATMLKGLFEHLKDSDANFGFKLKIDINIRKTPGSSRIVSIIVNDTVQTRTFTKDGVIIIPFNRPVTITLIAEDKMFISYYSMEAENSQEEPQYIYTYNTNRNSNYTANKKSTYTIQNMDSNSVFRAYFYEDGYNERLVNPANKANFNQVYNYGSIIEYNIIKGILGKTFADSIMTGESGSINDEPWGIKTDGVCFGISAASNMISQPWKTEMRAADYDKDKSYVVPNDIKGGDIGGKATDKLSLYDFVDALQAISLKPQTGSKTPYNDDNTGIMRVLKEEEFQVDNVNSQKEQFTVVESTESWDDFFHELDDYMNYGINPVILHISGNEGHAVVARKYEIDQNDSRNRTIYITDPNGKAYTEIKLECHEQVVYNDSTNSYEIIETYKIDYSGIECKRMSYLTFDKLIALWNDRNNPVTPNENSQQLVVFSISDGGLSGLSLVNSKGERIDLEEKSISTGIEDASLLSFNSEELSPGYSTIYIWLPEDTYTLTNTKENALTIRFSDYYAAVAATIDPGVTATIKVSDSSASENFVKFDTTNSRASRSIGEEECFAEMYFDESLGFEFNTISVSGTLSGGSATVTKTTGGVIAEGFADFNVTLKGLDYNKTMNSCTNLNGQAVFIDGVTAEVTGSGPITQDITYAAPVQKLGTPVIVDFNAGLAEWTPVSNAGSYNIGFYEDGVLVGFEKETDDCFYDFSGYMTDRDTAYTFTVQALAEHGSDTGYIDGDATISAAIYLPPAVELDAPENVGLYQKVGRWDAVAGATGYELSLYCNGESVIDEIITTDTSYDFSELMERGVYFFAVRALGDDINSFGSHFIRSNNFQFSPMLSPITSIKIDSEPSVLLKRNETYKFNVIVNNGASDFGIMWLISNPLYATVDYTGEVTVYNKIGSITLRVYDPISGLSNSIVLRII